MKRNALATLALALAASLATPAFAVQTISVTERKQPELTKAEVKTCGDLADMVEIMTKGKNDGWSKRKTYDMIMADLDGDKFLLLAADMAYQGYTPERTFDLCIKAKREN